MRVLILRSVAFADPVQDPFVDQLAERFRAREAEVVVYSMPAWDDIEHWAGYTIVDYSGIGDLMICVDFPTALIAHEHKHIILTKPLPKDPCFQAAISQAIEESEGCCKTARVNFDCANFPEALSNYLAERKEYP